MSVLLKERAPVKRRPAHVPKHCHISEALATLDQLSRFDNLRRLQPRKLTHGLPLLERSEWRRAKSGFYELLFTASSPDLAKTISDTNRMAPTTIALSATLKAGQ